MKKYLLIILFLAFVSPCWAETVTDGTSAGFVTVAPSADPTGSASIVFDTIAKGTKYTSPAGSNSVTSMGWWCNNATEAANFQIGIYSHDAGNDRPDALLASSGDVAKGTTAGWKTGSVDYDLTASTTYWIVVQLDDTATGTQNDRNYNASYKTDKQQAFFSLPSPWGTSDDSETYIYAIYALYSTTVTAKPQLIFITEN